MGTKMKPPSKQADEQKAAALIEGKAATTDSGKLVVSLRMDANLLARIDAAAKRQGISRTAWLHVAASKALDG